MIMERSLNKALYCTVTKKDFHAIPKILERWGAGVKDQVAEIYEEMGPVNGTLYVIGEIVPMIVGTKGLGAIKEGKAVAETANAAKIAREGEVIAGGVRVTGEAAELANAARLIGIKDLIEDLQAYSKLPALAAPGVPATAKMPWTEFRAMRAEMWAAGESGIMEGAGKSLDDIAKGAGKNAKVFKEPCRR